MRPTPKSGVKICCIRSLAALLLLALLGMAAFKAVRARRQERQNPAQAFRAATTRQFWDTYTLASQKRTFFFCSDGFEKGYELHSGQAETVEGLPIHAMKGYPYDPRTQPASEAHWRYLMDWNTRPSFIRW